MRTESEKRRLIAKLSTNDARNREQLDMEIAIAKKQCVAMHIAQPIVDGGAGRTLLEPPTGIVREDSVVSSTDSSPDKILSAFVNRSKKLDVVLNRLLWMFPLYMSFSQLILVEAATGLILC